MLIPELPENGSEHTREMPPMLFIIERSPFITSAPRHFRQSSACVDFPVPDGAVNSIPSFRNPIYAEWNMIPPAFTASRSAETEFRMRDGESLEQNDDFTVTRTVLPSLRVQIYAPSSEFATYVTHRVLALAEFRDIRA